jgi:hypothetical protein
MPKTTYTKPKRLKSKPERFKPFAYALAKPIVGQIWVIAVCGADCLRIELDTKLPSAVWMRYALARLPKTTAGFEKPYGVRINYRHDFSVDHDLDGKVIAVRDYEVPLGKATLTLDPEATSEDRIAFASLIGDQDHRPIMH